jgi:hypothetical protein
MPFKHEHSARISDPSKYTKFRRKNDEFGAGIDVIYGVTKAGKAEVQAIHFDADKFTTEDAKKWLKDHDYKPTEFVAATGDKGEEDEKYWDDEDESDEDEEEEEDDDDEEEMSKAKLNVEIEHKNLSFKIIEIKEATIKGVKTGIIEGYAATYGDIDRGGDVILQGAFKECLAKYLAEGRPVKMHYQHSTMDIIGHFPVEKIIDDEKGLYCRGEINLEVQRGREVYALAKQGAISDLSIGYSVDDFDYIKNPSTNAVPIRQLKKLTLWEISTVGEPMNPNAKITEVKMSVKDVTQLVGAEKITKKSQLARILRKSKGFTKRAAEYLVNLICLENKEFNLDVNIKTNIDNSLIDNLQALHNDLKKSIVQKEQDKIIKDLQNIKDIFKK